MATNMEELDVKPLETKKQSSRTQKEEFKKMYKAFDEKERKELLTEIMGSLPESSKGDSEEGATGGGDPRSVLSTSSGARSKYGPPHEGSWSRPWHGVQEVTLREPPRLSVFSGTPGRDATFSRWRSEVDCLRDDRDVTASMIIQAIRRSLRSPAADVVAHLDRGATEEDLMKKLESIYGTVLPGQAILQRFYSDTQDSNQDVAIWACHLEGLAYSALNKGIVARDAVEGMLKSQFFSGLRSERIKDSLRQRRQLLTFEELVVEARELEEEYRIDTNKTTSRSKQQQQSQPSEMELILQLLKKMDDRIERIEQQQANASSPPRHTGQTQKDPEGKTPPSTNRDPKSKATPSRNRRAVKCDQCGEEGHLSYGCRKGMSVECYKCGKTGHIARACRPLNSKQPQ